MVNDTCDVELMQPELYDLAAAVLGFIQIFGFTSNFLVIGLMLQDSKVNFSSFRLTINFI